MTDAISSNNRIKGPGPALDQRTQNAPRGAQEQPASQPASAVVELSSEQLLKQMQSLPEVDSQRVQSIKNALANGEYKPDPERIASKFAEIEKLLP